MKTSQFIIVVLVAACSSAFVGALITIFYQPVEYRISVENAESISIKKDGEVIVSVATWCTWTEIGDGISIKVSP